MPSTTPKVLLRRALHLTNNWVITIYTYTHMHIYREREMYIMHIYTHRQYIYIEM